MFEIKIASVDDIPLIRKLCMAVWPKTYADMISPEQIEYMLELMYSKEALERQMNEGAVFFLLFHDGEPVGYAAWQEETPGQFKLHKLYVLPADQGKGRGRFLLEAIIAACREKGGNLLALQVNRNNKARFFYEKLGFVIAREANFDIGNGYFMEDYVMERQLN